MSGDLGELGWESGDGRHGFLFLALFRSNQLQIRIGAYVSSLVCSALVSSGARERENREHRRDREIERKIIKRGGEREREEAMEVAHNS